MTETDGAVGIKRLRWKGSSGHHTRTRLVDAVETYTVGMQVGPLTIDSGELAAFCKRWKIAELSVFGSVLRDDFRPDSDVDFLVSFERDARWSYFEYSDMKAELAAIVGRPVDVAQRQLVDGDRNWIRRHTILQSARQLYAA